MLKIASRSAGHADLLRLSPLPCNSCWHVQDLFDSLCTRKGPHHGKARWCSSPRSSHWKLKPDRTPLPSSRGRTRSWTNADEDVVGEIVVPVWSVPAYETIIFLSLGSSIARNASLLVWLAIMSPSRYDATVLTSSTLRQAGSDLVDVFGYERYLDLVLELCAWWNAHVLFHLKIRPLRARFAFDDLVNASFFPSSQHVKEGRHDSNVPITFFRLVKEMENVWIAFVRDVRWSKKHVSVEYPFVSTDGVRVYSVLPRFFFVCFPFEQPLVKSHLLLDTIRS